MSLNLKGLVTAPKQVEFEDLCISGSCSPGELNSAEIAGLVAHLATVVHTIFPDVQPFSLYVLIALILYC